MSLVQEARVGGPVPCVCSSSLLPPHSLWEVPPQSECDFMPPPCKHTLVHAHMHTHAEAHSHMHVLTRACTNTRTCVHTCTPCRGVAKSTAL